jgi:hypothetical protein
MPSKFDKYFWDGKPEDFSPLFRVRRMIEYASFPDLIQYPFLEIKSQITHIQADKLRTSERRKEFIKKIQTILPLSETWEESIFTLIKPFFENNNAPIHESHTKNPL